MASIGIDLGTTNSVISRLEGGRPVPIVIDGSSVVPSVVLFDGERIVTGREARNLELLHPERTVRSVKRKMGSEHTYAIGDRMLTPEAVSAEILRALKTGAEQAIGEPVHDVVITVPAYFDDAQRRATLRAGELAGLHVVRLLNEPTSASLCYERASTSGAVESSENVLVYDLGGGTFDVSILEVFEGVREVRATAGNTRLGGDDFDDKLVSLFVDELRKREAVDAREDARALARLRRLAEDVKIRLSAETRVRAREEFVMTIGERVIHLDLEVTRRRFEELIDDLIDSTIALARKAVADAGLSANDLSRILLVGGSTRIPLVRRRLAEAFAAPVHEEVDVDLAVGLGAAIQSAILRAEPVDRILVDVTAHSLGIRVVGDEDYGDDEPDTYAPILHRNTVLPSSRTEEFYTVADGQTKLSVDVFQGEESRVSLNTPVGSFDCELEPRPARSPVTVEFSYDLNGVVTVSVSQPGSSMKKTVALSIADRAAQDTSSSAIERRAAELIARLSGDDKERLQALVATLHDAKGDARRAAEDALLDCFVELEEDDDGNDDDDDDDDDDDGVGGEDDEEERL